MDFVHLHVHSHFSLLDGAIPIKKLVRMAKELQMPALALTDHGNLFGAVQFYRAAKDAGVKPIIGMEAYVAPGDRREKKRPPGGAFYHLLLLARDEEGYQNLMRLSSLAYLEGFYYRPRIDKELLAKHARGLIGSSACLSSEINRAAVQGTEEELRAQIESYKRIFEPGCFFLEIQRNGLPEQERVLEKIPPLAREYGIPLIATNDVHYLQRQDARAQEVHLCINTGQTMDDADRMCFQSDQFYFRSAAEMERVLGDFKEAIANTLRVAEMCRLELDFSKTHLPRFAIRREDIAARGLGGSPAAGSADGGEPSEEELRTYFRKLCIDGSRERYPDFDRSEALQKRLEHEMRVIEESGYASYFLIVWDFVRYARSVNVPVGPGRGSAAGSLVAYALKITNIDPLKYDLLFERFLNAERVSMPDIDIDFCMDGREKVIEYVRRQYGEDRVCQIITFGTMAARAVLRDVGRALNIPLAEVDAIAKKIPAGPKVDLGASIEADPDLTRLRSADPRIRELFDISLRLEGLNRHSSTHAAGVVISDAPLIDTVPLHKTGEDVTTQFTMEDLEAVGILKMDFLGLRTLTVIDRCLDLVRKSRSIDLNIDDIPLDDAATYELLCRGDTVAVFQLESKGMRDILRRLRPDRFEDIIAVLALYRPGPLEGGMVDTYIQCKHDVEAISFGGPVLEPFLKPILEETNGVILYQEQVMRIANQLAGFTLNEADTLRKAMGKKKKELMVQYKERFVAGAKKNGIDARSSSDLFDLIEKFAGYGFNKSHSTAYALISYQTAYLKANYPTEFMAAVMTCEMSNTDNIMECLEECRRMGITIRPPDIQRSETGFTVKEGEIWYGLGAVKGLGGKLVDALVECRDGSRANGAAAQRRALFRSIYDLCERADTQALNKTVLESLIACGALDSFGQRRSQLAAVLENALARGAQARKDKKAGQATFFELFGDPGAGGNGGEAEVYPDLDEWSESERLSREKKTLGFYLSGHPLERWDGVIRQFGTYTLADIPSLADGTAVMVGVEITKITKKVSKRTGEPFWLTLVEDRTSTLEVFIGKGQYEEAREVFHEESIVFLKGSVRYRDTTASLRIERMLAVAQATSQLTEDLTVVLPLGDGTGTEDLLFRLKGLLQAHRGTCPVYLVFRGQAAERAIVRVGAENYVTPDLPLFEEIQRLCGRGHVLLNRMRRQRA